MDAPATPPSVNQHLPTCGPDCRAGEPMDPFLARVLAETDELMVGLTASEGDTVLRNTWIDDDGGVHLRDLRAVPSSPLSAMRAEDVPPA